MDNSGDCCGRDAGEDNVPSHSAFATSQDSTSIELPEEVVHLVSLTFYGLPRSHLNAVFQFAQDMGYPFAVSVQDAALDDDED